MRKLLAIVVILAFFAPVLRPLAHSAVSAKVCSLKGKTCAMHGHSCRHDAGNVSHASHHHEMEVHHKAEGTQGVPILKCGCEKNNNAWVLNIQEDPFVTGPIPMPHDSSAGLLASEAHLRDSASFPPVIQKPPTA